MRETLILLASLSLVLGLRSSRSRLAKKLAAFLFIFSMAYAGYVFSSHIGGAVLLGGVWFFLPLVTIYTKRAKKTYSFDLHEIKVLPPEKEPFFPNACNYKVQLEQLEFEPLGNRSWQWLDANQHHRFYWNPEVNTIASVCLCELENIVFTYIIFHSELGDNTIVRTTNYPFISPLKHQPHSLNKHVACEEVNLQNILSLHSKTLTKKSKGTNDLQIPNPEVVHESWAMHLQEKIQHNLEIGLISKLNNQFKFTRKGLFYLWIQSIIDLIRLC